MVAMRTVPLSVLSVGLVWLLAGCDFFSVGKTCASGIGIRSQAYTGTSLEAKQLALSFSGGPGDGTLAIDAALTAASVQAAFFVSGKHIVGRETTLAALKAHGHIVANQGYTDSPLESSLDAQREVRKTDALIQPYVTGNIYLLRAIGSINLSDQIALDLNKSGLSRYVGPIGWDIGDQTPNQVDDASCWQAGTSVSDCAAAYLAAIEKADKGIVRLHADDARSAELLQKLLPELKQANYQFVRLDAVSTIQTALKSSGATIGAVGGDQGCSDY
ncbi:MAG: polysaccharide deacetylase family protein [Deltaproteobacteria bacterium]|nr:polysaccharide deacetylase family protein [Deltaproteobacteria bacterium]